MGFFGKFGDAAKEAAKAASGISALEAVKDYGRVPKCELRTYAEQRRLTHHGSQAPAGFKAAVGVDDIYNTVEGVLPGGRYGLALHQHYDEDDHHGFQHRRTKHAITRIIVSVPAGLGSIQRMSIRRYDFDQTPDFGWAQVPPDRYGIAGRTLYFGANADRPAIDAVLHAAAPWLAAAESPGPFDEADLGFKYGALWIATKGYLEGAALDAACQSACAIADALEQASLAARPPRSFSDDLDGPFWAPGDEAKAPAPENPVQVAGSQGLDAAPSEFWVSVMMKAHELMPSFAKIEDGLEFHRSFPWLPAPGQSATGVLNGTVPGTQAHGRLAILTDTSHDSTSQGQSAPRAFTLGRGGLQRMDASAMFVSNSGVNALMVEVNETAQTPAPFEYGTDLQVSVREGVATFWRPRAGQRVTDGLPEFVAACVDHAKSRGWL